MIRLIRRSAKKKLGLRPGSVVYVGVQRKEPVRMEVIDFSATEYAFRTLERVEDVLPYRDSQTMSWINVIGVHDVDVIKTIGEHFGLHPLVMEDIANTGQRPKVDLSDDMGFAQVKMVYRNEATGQIATELVSIVFGKHWVLTFQEVQGDVFEHLRKRIETTVPRMRALHSDYVAYALIDAVVDHYYVILEDIGSQIEVLEDTIVTAQDGEMLNTIRQLKTDMVLIRKAIWPLREVVSGFERTESPLINDLTRPFIRDLYEHTIQVIDTVETFRDMVSGLLDLYQTHVANRMNEIMKVLTIIATIFIPLSFLAGVYGMNFDTAASSFNLPELGMRYGYPLFWLVVILVGGGLLWFFRRRRWL